MCPEDRGDKGSLCEEAAAEKDPLIDTVKNESDKDSDNNKNDSLERKQGANIDYSDTEDTKDELKDSDKILIEHGENGTACVDIEMKDVVNGKFEPDGDKGNKESEVFLELEASQKDTWIPDGGWGWAIVLGGVISHVYVGK